MKKTWIVVANREGARVFERSTLKPPVNLVHQFTNLQGKKLDSELGTERPGRSSDRGGTRHALSREQEPREHLLEGFLREVADYLEKEGNRHSYEQLFLVAEPHVLGMLRGVLPEKLNKVISGSMSKDLCFASEGDISERLAQVM